MSDMYMVKKKTLGCCNLVIWDFFMIIIVVGRLLNEHFNFHPVYCIVLGMLGAGIVIILMSVKFIGVIIKMFCSFCWLTIIRNMILNFAGKECFSEDSTWELGIDIFIFLICMAIHSIGLKEINDTNEALGLEPVDYSFLKKRFSKKDISSAAKTNMDNEMTEQFLDEYEQLTEKYKDILIEREKLVVQVIEILKEEKEDVIALRYAMQRNEEKCQKINDKLMKEMEIIQQGVSEVRARRILYELKESIETIKTENQYVLTELNKVLQRRYKESGNTYEDRHKEDGYNSNGYNKNKFNEDKDIHGNKDEEFFKGCTTKEEFTKRYRSLMKIYHPDNETGDTELTQRIKETYEKIIKNFD